MADVETIHQEMLAELSDSYQKTPGFPAFDFLRAFALAAASLAGDWQLKMGDPSLPAAVGGGYDKCYSLRCLVLLDRDGSAALRLLLHEGDAEGPEMLADPDSFMFLRHTDYESFVAQLSNSGSLSLIKLQNGAITGGVEYVRP